ncbi:hypothetical protein CKO08_02420 [Halorhodospira halochloris]|nr:hypothetical protein [Halorhodospira halochloris]
MDYGSSSKRILRYLAVLAVCLTIFSLTTNLPAQQRSDPTAPPGSGPGTSPSPAPSAPSREQVERSLPQVQMVMQRAGKSSAYIGGQWKGEGETVAGFRIEAIESNGVKVTARGEDFFLPVSGHGVGKKRLQPDKMPGAKGQ